MTEAEFKPIETYFRGYHFRSRTEARWAVFFDAAGIPFDYEREGFELPSGWYLPDFWLPEEQTWAEVKGQAFSEEETQLCRELALATHQNCLLLDGVPDLRTYAGFWWSLKNELKYGNTMVFGHDLIWKLGEPTQLPASTPRQGPDHLERAIAAARAARFEHGAVQPYNWSQGESNGRNR